MAKLGGAMSSSAENARHHERINIKPEVAAVCNQSEELARFVVEPQLCRVRISGQLIVQLK